MSGVGFTNDILYHSINQHFWLLFVEDQEQKVIVLLLGISCFFHHGGQFWKIKFETHYLDKTSKYNCQKWTMHNWAPHALSWK